MKKKECRLALLSMSLAIVFAFSGSLQTVSAQANNKASIGNTGAVMPLMIVISISSIWESIKNWFYPLTNNNNDNGRASSVTGPGHKCPTWHCGGGDGHGGDPP